MIRTILGGCFKAICLWGCVIVLFVGALVAVNSIPNDRILSNVTNSFSHVNYHKSVTGITLFDHWTECIVLTMGLPRSATYMNALEKTLRSPTIGKCTMVKKALLNGEDRGFNYYRYWHGYQLISRPVLFFTGANGLRITSFFIFALSFIVFFHAISIFVRNDLALIALVTLLTAPLYSQLYIVHFSLVWSIGFMFAATILWLLQHRRTALDSQYLWLFALVGMLTSYVDLLTNPLVTLTLPLLVLYWKAEWPDKDRISQPWMSISLIATVWSIGYLTGWAGKWLLSAYFFDRSIFGDIADQISRRLSGNIGASRDRPVSILSSIQANLSYWKFGLTAVVLCFIAAIVRTIRRLNSISGIKFELRFEKTVTFAYIFLLPIVWLALVKNHSVIHAWFVSPILYPSFAILISEMLTASSVTKRVIHKQNM